MSELMGADRFATADGTGLYYRWHRPAVERGRVVLVHGVTEHADRYEHLVNALLPAGYSLYAADHRGHGRSEGLRGHVSDFDTYGKDLAAFLDRIGPPPGPQILYGHSMGSLVALRFAAAAPERLTGLVLSSPPVRLLRPPGSFRRGAVKFLAALFPLLPVRTGLKPSALSTDPALAAARKADKLMNRRVTLRWAVAFFLAQQAVREQAEKISIPTLILQGEDDTVSDPAATRELAEGIRSDLVTARFFPGLRHEPHNEAPPDRARVFAALLEWMDGI